MNTMNIDFDFASTPDLIALVILAAAVVIFILCLWNILSSDGEIWILVPSVIFLIIAVAVFGAAVGWWDLPSFLDYFNNVPAV